MNVAYVNSTWGTFSISDVTVSGTSGAYTLEGNGTVEMTAHSSTSSYDCTFSANIASISNATFIFTVDVMGGTVVAFNAGDAPAAYNIAGTYSGYATAEFAYSSTPYTYADESLTVTANTDGTVNIAYENDTWGAFSVSDVTVGGTSGAYTLEGNGTVEMSAHGSTSSYDCTFSANIASETDATFTFTVNIMGGTVVTFNAGTAPAAFYIAGSYTGDLSMTSAYGEMLSLTDEVMTITANTDGTINFTYSQDQLGKYNQSNVELTENEDGTVSFTVEDNAEISMTSGGTGSEYPYTMTVSVADQKTMTTTMTYSFMGTTTVTFTGEKE